MPSPNHANSYVSSKPLEHGTFYCKLDNDTSRHLPDEPLNDYSDDLSAQNLYRNTDIYVSYHLSE